MTIQEVNILIGEEDRLEKERLEEKAQVMAIAVNSALAGKPVKLFDDKRNKKRVNRIGKDKIEEEKEALKDL